MKVASLTGQEGAPAGDATPVRSWTGRLSLYHAAAVAAIVAPVAAYVVYILHYGVNTLFWDDWTLVPLVHSALHGRLTFAQLWAPHNENRMLVPNLLFVVIAWAAHLDTRVTMLVSAAVYVGTYLIFLRLAGRYLNRRIGAVELLALGAVWFGFEDFENILWNFQLAWFLIVLCLFALLYLLVVARRDPVALTGGVALAVIASFSSSQGLILWPIGLLCLTWRTRSLKRLAAYAALWVTAAGLTTFAYLYHFGPSAFGGGDSSSYFYRHLGVTVRYLLAIVGSVVPTTATDLRIHEAIGAGLYVLVVYVVVRDLSAWRRPGSSPLAVSLIAFGLAFDLMAAVGRVFLGPAQALSSRYTLSNLLLLLGMALHFLRRRTGRPVGSHGPKSTAVGMAAVAVVVCLLGVQTAFADHAGVVWAGEAHRTRIIDARAVVNLGRVGPGAQAAVVQTYVFPSLGALEPLRQEAKADRLSVFEPALYRRYRREGFPVTAEGGHG